MYSLLVTNLIMPFVMILVGCLMQKNPAENRDPNHGYNTPASRKTQERWDYAQTIAPGIFISLGKILGVIEIVLSAGMFFLQVPIYTALCIGSLVGIGFLFFGFYKTDLEIEKKFAEG